MTDTTVKHAALTTIHRSGLRITGTAVALERKSAHSRPFSYLQHPGKRAVRASAPGDSDPGCRRGTLSSRCLRARLRQTRSSDNSERSGSTLAAMVLPGAHWQVDLQRWSPRPRAAVSPRPALAPSNL